MDTKFVRIMLKQLGLAKDLYSGPKYVKKLKANYERVVGMLCTKHHLHDSIFYVQNCGRMGYRAVKFYNDSSDYRIGSFQLGAAEAYTEAVCYM